MRRWHGTAQFVEAHLLAGLAHRELGDHSAANQAAGRALALAESDRLILPFAMTGSPSARTCAASTPSSRSVTGPRPYSAPGTCGCWRAAAPASQAPRHHGTHTVLTGLPNRSARYGVLAVIEALGLELPEIRTLIPAANHRNQVTAAHLDRH